MNYIQLYNKVKKLKKIELDEAIKKVAKENGLTKDQHQRLVEVTNIQTFLSKLANGTQSQDFALGTPVAPEIAATAKGDNGALLKAASMYDVDVPEHFFQISEDAMPTLPKVAMSANDSYLFDEDGSEHEAEQELAKYASEQREIEYDVAKRTIEDTLTLSLVDEFKNNQELIKCALAYASVSGNDDLAQLLMIDTNLTDGEILASEVNPETLMKFAAKKNSIRRDVKKVLFAAGILGAGATAANVIKIHQDVGDRRARESALQNQYRRKET